jgi:hypothetical protein
MILRQNDQPFVFDGAVLGNLYVSTNYFAGRAVSRFCAVKGEPAPTRCYSPADVAMLPPPLDDAQQVLTKLSQTATADGLLKAFFSPS